LPTAGVPADPTAEVPAGLAAEVPADLTASRAARHDITQPHAARASAAAHLPRPPFTPREQRMPGQTFVLPNVARI
jgi:hypothetical protein